jgi:type I restriction enzyme S subunit
MRSGNQPNLPPNWIWTRVEEIYDVIGGGTPSTSVEEYWNGNIPWITSADIHGLKDIQPRRSITEEGLENSATNLVPAGSIIVVTRVSLGKVGLVEEPLCFSQDSQALIYNHDCICPEYSLYYLSHAVQEFKHIGRGTTISGVTKKQLKDLKFALPPLNEQKRIVKKVDELLTQLDAGMAALKRAEVNLKRYKASLLKAACEGRLVATEAELARSEGRDYEPASELLEHILTERRKKWEEEEWCRLMEKAKQKVDKARRKATGRTFKRGEKFDPEEWQDISAEEYAKYLPKDEKWKEKYKEPKGPEFDELWGLPEGWTWATVDQLVDIQTGATPLRGKSKYWDEGNVPWVTSGALNEPYVNEANELITEVALRETNTKIFPTGTLLVAMYGEGRTRGKVSELLIRAATNQACAALVFGETANSSKKYVKLFFQKNYEDIRRLASGGVQPNLNLSIIRETPIPVPPAPEQERITQEVDRRLSHVNDLERSVLGSNSRAINVQQAILGRAFKGKLVTQDQDDEPANALLERIKSERDDANRRG